MKTQRPAAGRRRGSVLMITVCLSFIIGVVLLSCLSLVKSQNQAVARSQAWNICMPVVEAGIEEGMAHLNNKRESSYVANGWTQSGTDLIRQRNYGDGFYTVNINLTDPLKAIVVCTGYVRLPVLVAQANHPLLAAVNSGGVAYVCRAVQVVAKRQGLFQKVMLAKERIDMNGNGILTDSFDSTDPNLSTGGVYDPAKVSDNGDVGSIAGLTNTVGVGNADIKGRVHTGKGGTVLIGNQNGVVGSLAWHAAGKSGVEPGWANDDMNIWLPDVELPFTGGAFPPVGGVVTSNGTPYTYKYVLSGGNFELAGLDVKSGERIAVTGDSVLLVKGDVTMVGGVDILPGGSLQMYVTGTSATLGGSGINNAGRATNFVYFGLPSNKTLSLPSNGDFTGVIYAPSADLKLNGGGSSLMQFCGACVNRSITIGGHYTFHFDQSLRGSSPRQDYVIISWVEL
ncbi:MAG TPA: hypothetical protein VNU68_01350 [Verrucomicrobiae bacterium]|nr:hypothetical protein [Verrucomicrobiae bacterium]